jgi:hypothetical protein
VTSRRWQYSLDQRRYKCHKCLCLMGLWSICLNEKCERYRAKGYQKALGAFLLIAGYQSLTLIARHVLSAFKAHLER